MKFRKPSRPQLRMLICGSVAAALVVLLGSMAGTSGARIPTGGAGGKTFVYEPVHSLLIVKDKATYDYSATKWNGFGRLQQKLEPKKTGLPIVLARSGTYPITLTSNDTTQGDETLTTSGITDPCSGDWDQGTESGDISLQVSQVGAGKLKTLWGLPTGFASPICGRPYDQFGGGFEAHATVGGEIGDRHLVLEAQNKKTETSPDGSTQQTISWDGRVVLDRK